MFETAVVRGRGADRKLLVISLIGHSAIVVAVVFASLASTRLPDDAPKQMLPVFFSEPLPAMSNPAPAQPKAAPPKGSAAPAQARVPVPQVVTPSVIPDAIPAVAPSTASPSVGTTSDDVGDPNGKKDSVGTDPNAPAGPAAAAGPYVPGIAGVTSPIVIRRVEPQYPIAMARVHMNGWVILQCIIDKTGHIRDVQVVHSSFGAFEQPAIDAVNQWLFSPGLMNGQPVDVIFDLTVKFEIR
jgi:periplasmic protein TonB